MDKSKEKKCMLEMLADGRVVDCRCPTSAGLAPLGEYPLDRPKIYMQGDLLILG